MSNIREMIHQSILDVEQWVENSGYRGYEPFDGLSSRLAPLTGGNLFLERLLQQLVRQCPVNLRPVLGVKKLESTKGRGYMAWGYLTMYRVTGDVSYLEKAGQCLEWLVKSKSPFYDEFSWGNHFDFSSRGGRLPRHEPIIVWSSIIGQVFLDAFDITGDGHYLDVAKSICRWIEALPRERTSSGSCLSYVAFGQRSIHNSNMLGAAMLARTSRFTNNDLYRGIAREAMRYSCSRQLPDGAWFYGESPNMHWIDNFHTGYNLDSLKCYIENTGDRDFDEHLRKGIDYYKRTFIEADGRPKYYHNRAYPIDSQCASQCIETLANFSDHDPESLELATSVARWTIANMRDDDGYFYYRRYPFIKDRTPMLHWAQATTYRALALLLNKLLTDSVDISTQDDSGKYQRA